MSLYQRETRYSTQQRARKLISNLAAFLQDCSERQDFDTLGYVNQDIRSLLDTIETNYEVYCNFDGYRHY